MRTLPDSDLPEGEVTVAVRYSDLNYKDGLALTGASPVVRSFPMVPGIDLAGVVEQSSDDRWQPGDKVMIRNAGAYTSSYSSVGFNGFPPLDVIVI